MLMSLLVGRAQAEKALLVGRLETSQASSVESRWDLPLSLKIQVAWGVSLAVTMGQGGCSTLSHPLNFGVLSLGLQFQPGG